MELAERPPSEDIRLSDGRAITIGPAVPDDVLGIRWLYHLVYGGSYPFSLVYNPQECQQAIESDRYVWLLARAEGKVVGSLLFNVDRQVRLAKAFGAVVAEDYRRCDVAEKLMVAGLEILSGKDQIARTTYATVRTVSLGPQRLAEKAGFLKLGVFPNVHKVYKSETHTLAVRFAPGVMQFREGTPCLPLSLKPFFSIVRRESGIDEAEYADLPLLLDGVDGTPLAFEVLQASKFILRRWAETKAAGKLSLDFFPFHEPNLLLVSPDGRTEVYLYRSAKDGHCVFTGAYSLTLELRQLLEHAAACLEGMGVRYLELLADARDPEGIRQALSARFIPSGYYPAMRWDTRTGRGRDYVVMSRSLAILDFKGVSLQPGYEDYLKEYYRLWRELYVGKI
ncbi:MAG: GNAT family N-acetyltransferase [Elusimicrobia bacterium]|nr:GNAT family N-acetyltransferase [Elusimicrobiota bacterium]